MGDRSKIAMIRNLDIYKKNKTRVKVTYEEEGQQKTFEGTIKEIFYNQLDCSKDDSLSSKGDNGRRAITGICIDPVVGEENEPLTIMTPKIINVVAK